MSDKRTSITIQETFGTAVVDYRPEKWAAFVLHLITKLEKCLDKSAARAFLLEIRDAIQARLDNGIG